jgi:hypothetical protein
MRKVAFFAISVFFILFSSFSHAQKKVKYKDIWNLLNVKQYEAAEPFLKTYLKENDDNPNAFLYMGIVYQDKAIKDDVLKQSALAIAHMDSAIFFYNKAYQTITEKEIKKNDEYYQAYNRRDLRSGEYGVKLSDVQFDIEKRTESMRERIDRVKMVKFYFLLSDSLYQRSASLFGALQKQYGTEKHFYLRADETTLKSLSSLIARYDSCVKAFEQFKGSAATLGKIGYNQVLSKKEIKDFASDGTSTADFYQDEIVIWDYKTFAAQAKQNIVKDILPMREHLMSYDKEINKLQDKLIKDSVSVRNDLTKLVERLLMSQLKKYDEHPLPMDVFAVKIADLDYKSTIVENARLKDSSNIELRLLLARKELASVTTLDSVATVLANRQIAEDAKNYQYFVSNAYSSADVLVSFAKAAQGFAQAERRVKEAEVAKLQRSLGWLVINSNDSVPLTTDLKTNRFQPLVTVNDKYTTGLHYTDSITATGYFYSITPSRIPDVKVEFPLDKGSFRQSQLKNTKSLTYSDGSGQLYFVLLFTEKPGKDNKYSATLAKIYRSDGLAWSGNYSFNFLPKEISFRADTGELMVKADAVETVIDKNGKLLR